MNKYNNSKIYKITSNVEPCFYYIGSTTSDLNVRLRKHKYGATQNATSKKNTYFDGIGWNVNITLLQEINVNTLKELLIIENGYIDACINDELCLNTNNAVMNAENRKIKNAENGKRHYVNHQEEMKQKHNEYYANNKDKKAQQYQENKDIINEHRRSKMTCICGAIISIGNKSNHEKSKSHIDIISTLQLILNNTQII